jgi:hypothetical protein
VVPAQALERWHDFYVLLGTAGATLLTGYGHEDIMLRQNEVTKKTA